MIRRWELCKVGVHGSAGTPVTEQDLKEIESTFSNKAPITISHKLTSVMPKMGNVLAVYFNELKKTLDGDVELNELGEKLYSQGWFDGWSIGSPKRGSDGKRYLHHLALCGEVPPAVKGLKDLGLSLALEDLFAKLDKKDLLEADDGTKTEEFPANPKSEKQEELMKTPEELQKELDEEKRKNVELSSKVTDLETKQKEGKDAKNLSDLQNKNTALQKQIAGEKKKALRAAAEGKLPKEKLEELVEFADQLSPEETIELADEAGKKEKISPLDLLTRIFAAVKKPVEEGELSLSDPNAGEGKGKAEGLSGLAKYC